MKRSLLLCVVILLGSGLLANAQSSWPVTVYTGTAAEHTTPLATIQVTRTPLASGNLDSLEMRLVNWLNPAYQTGGPHGVGAEINIITGEFTAVGSASPKGISLPGDEDEDPWVNKTTWNYSGHGPSAAPPASFVNLENPGAVTFTRTGSSPYSAIYGSWYALASVGGPANLAKSDYAPGDFKDQTLFAMFYVEPGTDLSFVADPALAHPVPGTDGVNIVEAIDPIPIIHSVYFTFNTTVVPEPGTIALMASSLIGLLCYAWRRRKVK